MGAFKIIVLAAALAAHGLMLAGESAPFPEMVVTNSIVLPPGTNTMRLIVRASHITIEGRGAVLAGPGTVGNAKSMENAGAGILLEGVSDVTITNVFARGFATGLEIRHSRAVSVMGCDFSDNYHNPEHGWGELPPRGGINCEDLHSSVIRGNKANRVWNALRLADSDDNLIEENDFSHTSNTGASLWKSSRNKFLRNNFSYGIRIDRAKGEVHARDSTGVLIETGSNDNYWFRNDVTYGGDGIFIRPLNRWVSRGNIFVENDTSYANNNCVESWSPGNTFIRNKANYGSYGFWLGGSDQTVLIGNEAAFNGLTNGNHNAPEPGFRHGGIVIVGGPSSHTLIEGNDVHDNNGAGIAFRGDVGTQGRAWKTEHWVVQRNRIASNRFGIWGRWGKDILVAANTFSQNSQGNYLTNVSNLRQLEDAVGVDRRAPVAILAGPEVIATAEKARFDAGGSFDPGGRALNFRWSVNGESKEGNSLEQSFATQGLYRVSLTVDNGTLGALAWRDVMVVNPVAHELGTEGDAGAWGFEMEGNNDAKGRMTFASDPNALVGGKSIRFTPDPYPGMYVTAIYPASKDAKWNFSAAKEIRFWIKVENPNLPGFQNAGPVVRLLGAQGELEFKPAKEANLLNDPPFSEARWTWMPVIIPLSGNEHWKRTEKDKVSLEQIRAVSVSLDSWGGDPFNVWLDGLTVD